jgi:hypothetical protein
VLEESAARPVKIETAILLTIGALRLRRAP